MNSSHLCKKSLGLLIVRLAVGAVFISHGWDKIQHMDAVIKFFGNFGFAPFWAYFVGWLELVGGISLILGIFIRYAAALLAVVMIFAIFAVKLKAGHGFPSVELETTLFASLVSLVIMGGGKWQLISGCKCKCHGTGKMCGMCKVVGCDNCEKETSDNKIQ